MLKHFIRDEAGMETVEWAIMAALIVLGAIVAVTSIGGKVATAFTNLDSKIP